MRRGIKQILAENQKISRPFKKKSVRIIPIRSLRSPLTIFFLVIRILLAIIVTWNVSVFILRRGQPIVSDSFFPFQKITSAMQSPPIQLAKPPGLVQMMVVPHNRGSFLWQDYQGSVVTKIAQVAMICLFSFPKFLLGF